MGIEPSQSADFHHKYNISPDMCLSSSQKPENSTNYIASILQLTPEVNYSQLNSIIQQKINSSCSYITKVHDKLESQTIKICSNHQRTTIVYRQTGVNLTSFLQKRKNMRKLFNEQDAIYLIECVVRGLKEFKRIGDASQILTTSNIIWDVDNRFKVLDPFLIASDSFSQDKTYSKHVQHIYGLENKFSSEEVRRYEMRFKYLVCQTEEKKVDVFHTSLFALACICLSLLNFQFDLENFFSRNSSKRNKQLEFEWPRYHMQLKRIKNQNLRQKLWLLTSQYHNQRAEIFQFLDKRLQDPNYPIDLLLKNTTVCNNSYQPYNNEPNKFSLARYQGPLKQSIRVMPTYSIKLEVKQSDVKKPLTTFSSTNNSQLHTQPYPTHEYSQVSIPNHNYCNRITFNNQSMMKRSLPLNVLSSNSPSFAYTPVTLQNSQIINVPQNHHLQHFHMHQPSAKTTTSNHMRQPSLQQILSKKSLINDLQDEYLKIPADQRMSQTNKRIKTLDDLQQEQHESIHAEVQEHSQHSQNVERVDINEVFPGYSQQLNCSEGQLSPINHIQTFQQLPLNQLLVNGVIQEDSAQNSLSEQSEVQNQSEFVIQQYTNGGRYEGYKHNQTREGYGKLFFSNGQIYDGEWKNNKMHGFGKLYYDENTLVYEGHWKEDSFHGSGKLFNLDIEPMKTACDFLNFSANYNSWKKYQGDFIEDIKEGKGRLTFQNDEYYEGEFKADKISGKGLFVGKNGCRIQGEWSEWKLVKIY